MLEHIRLDPRLIVKLADSSEHCLIPLDGYRLREADGWTTDLCRKFAGIKNMCEGAWTTTELDIATFCHFDGPDGVQRIFDLVTKYVPPSNLDFKKALALARLNPEALKILCGIVNAQRLPVLIDMAAFCVSQRSIRQDLHVPALQRLMEARPEPKSVDEGHKIIEGFLSVPLGGREATGDLFNYFAVDLTPLKNKEFLLRAVKDELTKRLTLNSLLATHAHAVRGISLKKRLVTTKKARKDADKIEQLIDVIDVSAMRPQTDISEALNIASQDYHKRNSREREALVTELVNSWLRDSDKLLKNFKDTYKRKHRQSRRAFSDHGPLFAAICKRPKDKTKANCKNAAGLCK